MILNSQSLGNSLCILECKREPIITLDRSRQSNPRDYFFKEDFHHLYGPFQLGREGLYSLSKVINAYQEACISLIYRRVGEIYLSIFARGEPRPLYWFRQWGRMSLCIMEGTDGTCLTDLGYNIMDFRPYKELMCHSSGGISP